MFSAVPLMLGWLAIAISVEQFYWPIPSEHFLFILMIVGRALSGLGSGWVSLVVPVSLKTTDFVLWFLFT